MTLYRQAVISRPRPASSATLGSPPAAAVVTGAASGIGRSLAVQLAEAGHPVLAADRDEAALARLAGALEGAAGVCRTRAVDVAEPGASRWLIDEALAELGRLDAFFANAGGARYQPWHEADPPTAEALFACHVLAPVEAAQALRRRFPAGPPRLVITTSAQAEWAVPGYAAYAASKAAIERFVDGIRAEGEGGWITLADPAATDTGFFARAGPGVPRALGVQSPEAVAAALIRAARRGRRRVTPSPAFRWARRLERLLPVFRRLYVRLERRKLRRWQQAG